MFKLLILTVFQEKQVTCSWSVCSRICNKIPALGDSWSHPGLGEMPKTLILTVFMEINMLSDAISSLGAKETRFEGEEKIVKKRRKLVAVSYTHLTLPTNREV